jgi:hypothetical protein
MQHILRKRASGDMGGMQQRQWHRHRHQPKIILRLHKDEEEDRQRLTSGPDGRNRCVERGGHRRQDEGVGIVLHRLWKGLVVSL